MIDFKCLSPALTITLILSIFSLQAQEELIGPVPLDRGKQVSWKEPHLLPQKYAKNLRYEAITYGREGLIPLPSTSFGYKVYDWNKDGIDDIVGCNYPFHQGDPYIIVYQSSGGENPRFTSPEESQIILNDSRLGRFFDFMDVDGDGSEEIITFQPKSKNIIAFKNVGSFENPEWVLLDILDTDGNSWNHIQDVLKTPPFTVADWDNDGRKDLIVGANHPSIMKHSYGIDPLEMRPEAFRVYFVKNIGKGGKTLFGLPQLIVESGEPVKYSGFSYPLAIDIDGDDYPDLVSGEHRPGVKVYRNLANKLPEVKHVGFLKDETGVNLSDVIYFHLEAGDITGDGKIEFVSTTQFSGTTYYYPLYSTKDQLRWVTGENLKMKGTKSAPIYGPAICTVEPVDWDNDGDMDLLAGAEPGMPMLFENIGDNINKIYSNPVFIQFYDGRPVRTFSVELGDGSSHGAWEWYDDRSTPTVGDWDGDGINDIVSTTQGRRLYWMKGKIIDGELSFSYPMKFQLNGSDLFHPHRSKPGLYDWNKDGKMDLIALNTVSEIVIFLGNQNSNLKFTEQVFPTTINNDPLVGDLSIVEPPMHISLAGRTGIAVFDWDHDGNMDIITHKHRGTVLYYRNTGEGAKFEPARVLFDFDSHLAGPSVMDYNNDGYPDIILGGDRKRYVGEKELYPKPVRAQFMWYDGSSLPFPSTKR